MLSCLRSTLCCPHQRVFLLQASGFLLTLSRSPQIHLLRHELRIWHGLVLHDILIAIPGGHHPLELHSLRRALVDGFQTVQRNVFIDWLVGPLVVGVWTQRRDGRRRNLVESLDVRFTRRGGVPIVDVLIEVKHFDHGVPRVLRLVYICAVGLRLGNAGIYGSNEKPRLGRFAIALAKLVLLGLVTLSYTPDRGDPPLRYTQLGIRNVGERLGAYELLPLV
jgi:hypothetical protein